MNNLKLVFLIILTLFAATHISAKQWCIEYDSFGNSRPKDVQKEYAEIAEKDTLLIKFYPSSFFYAKDRVKTFIEESKDKKLFLIFPRKYFVKEGTQTIHPGYVENVYAVCPTGHTTKLKLEKDGKVESERLGRMIEKYDKEFDVIGFEGVYLPPGQIVLTLQSLDNKELDLQLNLNVIPDFDDAYLKTRFGAGVWKKEKFQKIDETPYLEAKVDELPVGDLSFRIAYDLNPESSRAFYTQKVEYTPTDTVNLKILKSPSYLRFRTGPILINEAKEYEMAVNLIIMLQRQGSDEWLTWSPLKKNFYKRFNIIMGFSAGQKLLYGISFQLNPYSDVSIGGRFGDTQKPITIENNLFYGINLDFEVFSNLLAKIAK